MSSCFLCLKVTRKVLMRTFTCRIKSKHIKHCHSGSYWNFPFLLHRWCLSLRVVTERALLCYIAMVSQWIGQRLSFPWCQWVLTVHSSRWQSAPSTNMLRGCPWTWGRKAGDLSWVSWVPHNMEGLWLMSRAWSHGLFPPVLSALPYAPLSSVEKWAPFL